MDKSPAPPLLPIFRSRQQAELLALLLGDPDLEIGISDLATQLDIPYPSVHREVERGQSAGILLTRRIGRTRLVRANPSSPYFDGLSTVLVRAFGVPSVVASSLDGVRGIVEAHIFGSWAARYHDSGVNHPVGDVDLLVLGAPDRDELYERIGRASEKLGRTIQVTIREPGWLDCGDGSFHDTVVSRPMVPVAVDMGSTS